MNSKWLLIAWLATGMLCGACERTTEAPKTEAPPAAEATWLTNFETAQARARSEKKLLLIEFTGSDWCPPCIMLERQVFSQPEFKEYAAQHLVLLEVDFPRTKELSDEQKSRERKTGGTIWNRRIPDHHHPGLEWEKNRGTRLHAGRPKAIHRGGGRVAHTKIDSLGSQVTERMKTIAVLGGGSAGFTAARIALENGARVLFFMGDNADHASLCVDAGCMPSKALFEPIDAMHHAKQHGWLEVKPKQPDEYLAQIVRWKDNEIGKFRAYRQKAIREHASDRFQIIRSNASFVSAHEVVSEGKRHPFDAAIIATGSVTVLPTIDGLDPAWDGVWTSDEILHNTRIPKSLAVIGVGAIGLEFSFVMRGWDRL